MVWFLELHDTLNSLHNTCSRISVNLDWRSSVIDIILDRMMVEVDLKSSYWNSLYSDVHILTGSIFGMAIGLLF
jgi:hypothetical protein